MVNRNYKDLLVVIALAILAVEAIVIQANKPSGLFLLALPLVFLLPGYSVTAALFPNGGHGFPETLAFSLGLSLAVDIVGGLIINLTPQGFAPLPWTIFLVSVTCAGCAIAALNRRHRLEPTSGQSRLGLSVSQVFLLGLSVVVVASAMMIVRDQAAGPASTFTELWSRPASADGQIAFDVGVRNAESKEMNYALKVQVGETVVYELSSIALAPGETWEKTVVLGTVGNEDVQVFLYRMDSPSEIYRQTRWRSGSG